jgi:F-box-like
MDTFGRTASVEQAFDAAKFLEAAIACELHAQDMETAQAVAQIQADIDASEEKIAHHYEVITVKHAEREKCFAAVREEGRARLEELQGKLADAKHKLSVVNSRILILPYEATAEIFIWHMFMGGNVATVLLVCKRWKVVAYSSPRLWSRIAVTDAPPNDLRLQGAIQCTDLDQLRSVLSHVQSSPLQIEILFRGHGISRPGNKTSLKVGRHVSANRVEATKIILDNQVLRRCTSLVLGKFHLPYEDEPLPVAVDDMTVLPLLSSIDIYAIRPNKHELHFIQSLLKLSPSLRHIRCNDSLSLQKLGAGIWTKRVESYHWIFPFKPCHLLDGSPSLRELGIHGDPDMPLTLPALKVIRWEIPAYSALHHITAPHLHTLILLHPSFGGPVAHPPAGSITLPNLRVAIHFNIYDPTILHGFQTPALEHLSIQSTTSSPVALFDLFDGSAHMPTPKSLHLDCAFTDGSLITVLGRLPWLEELQVAGAIVQDTFWKALTPSCDPGWLIWLPASYSGERTTWVLTPNLKILLINYETGDLYSALKLRPTNVPVVTRKQRIELAQVWKLPDEDWECIEMESTVMQASAAALARERAGAPLEILACYFPEQKPEVIIGSLDTLPKRPK